jgi:hypothetical protein
MPNTISHFSISPVLTPYRSYARMTPRRYVLYNGALAGLIRARRKEIRPGKIPILTDVGRRARTRPKAPPVKGFSKVQPFRGVGCTFLLGGVRFAQLLSFTSISSGIRRRKHG